MKEIKLSQGLVTKVDDEDYEYLAQWKWRAMKSRNTYYAVRYEKKSGKDIAILMHRILMKTPDNLQVDHKDRDGLNNQKYNIRNCTHVQNLHNQKKKGKLNKYKGVYVINKNNIIAVITLNYKQVWRKRFKTEEEAAREYDKMASVYFGEFAELNFPILNQ